MKHNIQNNKMSLFLGVFSIMVLLLMAAECDITDKGKADTLTITPATTGNPAAVYTPAKDADGKVVGYPGIPVNKKVVFEAKAKSSKGKISYALEKYNTKEKKLEAAKPTDAVVTPEGAVTILTEGLYYLIATAAPSGEYKSATAKALLGTPNSKIELTGAWQKPSNNGTVSGTGPTSTVVTNDVSFTRTFKIDEKEKEKYFLKITPVVWYETTAAKDVVELVSDGTKAATNANKTGTVIPKTAGGGIITAKVQFPYTFGSTEPSYTAKK